MPRNPSENPVVLSRIYTRTGDDGSTALADGSRTAKTDSRLTAYADVEEANCAIGTAITVGDLAPGIAALLTRVQNELFDVGADLANPVTDKPAPYPPLRIDEAYITRLETECDSYNSSLPTLRSFLLPGGSPGATLLHTARTVTRRAERGAWPSTAMRSARCLAVTSTGCLTCCSFCRGRPTRDTTTCCGSRAASGEGRFRSSCPRASLAVRPRARRAGR
jgi:cob(I)alamin adenosyltransferase